MNRIISTITESQLEILKVFWREQKEMSVQEIIQSFESNSDWSASTIKTLIWRLHKHEVLAMTYDGVRKYTSVVSEEDYRTCGLIRPSIYMPTHLCGEERNYARKHEKAHLPRHDLVVRLATSITTMIHWFNPLAKGLQAELEQTSELACDADTIRDNTVSLGDDRVTVSKGDFSEYVLFSC